MMHCLIRGAVTLGLIGVLMRGVDSSAFIAIHAPHYLNSNAPEDTGSDSVPRVATDSSGTWIAVWQSDSVLDSGAGPDLEILFSRSTDMTSSWSAPAALNTDAPDEASDDVLPDVAVANNTWIAAWSVDPGPGLDIDLKFARSTNGGATWSSPQYLNTDATSDSHDDDWVRLAADGQGVWVAVWQTRVPGSSADRTLRTSRSIDDGVTWSTPVVLPPPGELAQTPQIATDGNTWVITWDERTATDHDIRAVRSIDAGATWSSPTFVNSTATSDSEHDMLQSLVTDGSGTWISAWQSMEQVSGIGSDWDILVSRSSDGINWDDITVLNSNAYADSSTDRFPFLLFESGTWIALWESADDLQGSIGNDFDLLVATSTDGGLSWTDASPIFSEASLDSGADRWVTAASDGAGSIVVAWQSDDSQIDTIGTDLDILFVNCSPQLPVADEDCDGYSSAIEAVIGTDPDAACGFTVGGDQASDNWPPDLVESNGIDISDVLALKPIFGSAIPPASPRYDLVPDGSIDISDVLALKPYFGSTCDV